MKVNNFSQYTFTESTDISLRTTNMPKGFYIAPGLLSNTKQNYALTNMFCLLFTPLVQSVWLNSPIPVVGHQEFFYSAGQAAHHLLLPLHERRVTSF